MTRSQNVRVYRACQRCRQRKLKCDQNNSTEGTSFACLQCFRAGNQCILAGSRRGGDFSRYRRRRQQQNPRPSELHTQRVDGHETESGKCEDPIYAELTNPGDALQILARLAAHDNHNPNHLPQRSPSRPPAEDFDISDEAQTVESTIGGTPTEFPELSRLHSTLSETETLVITVLGLDIAVRLLKHYVSSYHTFCPLAPKKVLATKDLLKTSVEEPFLLTVILTIASKDDSCYREVHQHCWRYLKRHLLDVLLATPATLKVGSVEGLLLLAEWVPYLELDTDSYPQISPMKFSAVEDNMAWSLIGQAVRHSYLLRLDKASFRETAVGETAETRNRKLLAWIFVYISDRQISVRMGQSFWSRGPSLSTTFTAEDFPSLRLKADAAHKYAHVLQATLELTQLLHNVHDILHASKERSAQMVRRGDYNRYLDDFRQSINSWEEKWNDLHASPKLSCTMHIFKEYVRLYASSFAFQSLLSKAVKSTDRDSATIAPGRSHNISLFPQGIMSTPEGPYILESIDAARSILTLAVQMTSSEAQICYMPFRFYVYTVYSAVFLYKANFFGALVSSEFTEIASLAEQYIHALEGAAISDSHVAGRFASLLRRMWLNAGRFPSSAGRPNVSSNAQIHTHRPQQPVQQHTYYQRMDMANECNLLPGCFDFDFPDPLFLPTPDFDIFCPEFLSF